MAVIQTKEFIGSTGSPYWTWKIIVTEQTGSTTDYTSPVTIDLYLGRTSAAGGSYFSGSATLNYSAGGLNHSEGVSVGYQTVGAGAWYKIGSHTFNVSNPSANTIQVSGSMSGANFSPYNGSASGTIKLALLHQGPTINGYTMTETALASSYNVNTTIVNLLSNKMIVFSSSDLTFYDGATLTGIKVYDGNGNQIGSSTTTTVNNCDFRNNTVTNGNITFEISDNKNGKTTKTFTQAFINYKPPTLENSNTKMVRSSTASGGITAGYVDLSLKGAYFYANNTIGIANTITNASYKIWEENTTEPSSYTQLTNLSLNQGVVSKTSTLHTYDFQKRFYYKFIITDNFGKSSEVISGILPTGISVWDEEEDHVNFLEITKDENPIHSYNVLFEGTPTKTPTLSDNVSNYELLLVLAGVGDGTVETQVYPVLKYSNKFGANWKIIATEQFHTNVSFVASGTSATLTVREVFGWDASVVKIFKIVGYK